MLAKQAAVLTALALTPSTCTALCRSMRLHPTRPLHRHFSPTCIMLSVAVATTRPLLLGSPLPSLLPLPLLLLVLLLSSTSTSSTSKHTNFRVRLHLDSCRLKRQNAAYTWQQSVTQRAHAAYVIPVRGLNNSTGSITLGPKLDGFDVCWVLLHASGAQEYSAA